MTSRPEYDPHEQEPHQRLVRIQAALANALDGVLDVEAGLREILILSHHDTGIDGLHSVLDTEAGLAAILPSAHPSNPPRTHTPLTSMETETLLRTIKPEERLALRNESEVKRAGQTLARTLEATLALGHGPPDDVDAVLGLAADLAVDLTRDLAHGLGLARSLARDLSITAARELDLSRAAAVVTFLGRAREFGAEGGRLFAHTPNGDLTPALDLAHTRALALARDLERNRAIALTFRLNVAHELDLALDTAHDRAVALNRLLGFGPGLDRSLTTRGLVDLIVDIRTAEMCRAIGLALRQKPFTLDVDSLHTLLDDFVTADLRDADLTGIDLKGVYWSELGTLWPAGLDVESLKDRSKETFPNSGTWVVRFGTATIHDLADR